MKKLLFVMLVPVFILGVAGCGKIDPDVQTDHLIQGQWFHDKEDYSLTITPDTLVVKTGTVSKPYRTEFSYVGERKSTDTKVTGDITLYDYKDKTEVATIRVAYDGSGPTLKISDTDLTAEEFYYNDAFPLEGTYTGIAPEGGGGGGGGDGDYLIVMAGTTELKCDVDMLLNGSGAGTVTISSDKKSFTVDTTENGYGNALAYFKVDFGSKKLSDYTKVRFTFKAASGDTNSKTICVYGNAAEPSGYTAVNGTNFAVAATSLVTDLTVGDDYELTISTASTLACKDESTVYFIIMAHAEDIVHTVSNIAFVE
jgi:hypothetical protein